MDNQSFFSIDRLVEFGLGMGIAQQMVGMMNRYMQQMYVETEQPELKLEALHIHLRKQDP